METLLEDDKQRLELETIRGRGWLTLVDKPTGNARILLCETTAKARAFVQGLTLQEFSSCLDRAQIPVTQGQYKPMRQPA